LRTSYDICKNTKIAKKTPSLALRSNIKPLLPPLLSPRFASSTKESKPQTIDMEIGCRFFFFFFFAETKSTAC
jgi:hypothetical protein